MSLAAISRHPLAHMAGGFLAMGGWAAFANRQHAMPDPLIAGVVQGTASAVITLGLKRMIDAVSGLFADSRALWLPPLIACAASLILLTVIHSLAGTPEVALTIAVPLTVATIYAAIYSYSLWRTRHG
jgi:hypothetical protein